MNTITKFLMTGTLALSTAAFADASASLSSADLNLLDTQSPLEHGGGMHKFHMCGKKAWEAASPTDAQTQAAKDRIGVAKAVVDAHKDALKTDIGNLIGAWKKYPIVKDEVVQSETALQGEFTPVKDAIRDAQIDILNSLSADQRTAFDTAFIDCLHAKRKPAPAPKPTP